MRPHAAARALALLAALGLVGCKSLNVPDYYSASLNALQSDAVTPTTVKTAAQDITGVVNSLKSSKTKAIGLGSLGLVVAASLLAHLKYIF